MPTPIFTSEKYAVIHNPILIYKLSKCSHVNIIEMTDGYVEDVVKFVENTK